MKVGDTVILKDQYNVSVSFGNIGFVFGPGTEGIVFQVEDNTSSVSVGFKLTDTITVTTILDSDSFICSAS
jgi:hypothetical protein